MSKSARIAIPSSPASRSSLTPPAASSASPKSTPTLPPKSKPQKSNPPRSKGTQALGGQPFLGVPSFFPCPLWLWKYFRELSALFCAPRVSALSFFFQILTFDFRLPSLPRPCTMKSHRGYSIPHV